MKTFRLVALLIIFVSSISTVSAAGDPQAGKQKAAVCAACHGADGNSPVASFPKLAGQNEAYLVKQLVDYANNKSGRQDPVMLGMVAGLSKQDMQDLASYFASQKASQGVANVAEVDLGQNIYRGGITGSSVGACIGCHGPKGTGNPAAKYPRVSGQHADYLVTQLKAFRNSARANDPQRMMRNIASRMTDQEIRAVAEYMAGLY